MGVAAGHLDHAQEEEEEEEEEGPWEDAGADAQGVNLFTEAPDRTPMGNLQYELVALTEAEDAEVDGALGPGADDEKLVENIPVSRDDMRKLRPGVWLGNEVRALHRGGRGCKFSRCDCVRGLRGHSACPRSFACVCGAASQVINLFMKLLSAREAVKSAQLPKCHFMQTFFYMKLAEQRGKGYCYKDVKLWTKNADVFKMDLIIVPIHCHGNHWTLAVINLMAKRFEYYDSLRGGPDMVRQRTPSRSRPGRTSSPHAAPSPLAAPTCSGGFCSVRAAVDVRCSCTCAAGWRTSTKPRRRRRTTRRSGVTLCGRMARRRSRHAPNAHRHTSP
jgi:hypothetical protein